VISEVIQDDEAVESDASNFTDNKESAIQMSDTTTPQRRREIYLSHCLRVVQDGQEIRQDDELGGVTYMQMYDRYNKHAMRAKTTLLNHDELQARWDGLPKMAPAKPRTASEWVQKWNEGRRESSAPPPAPADEGNRDISSSVGAENGEEGNNRITKEGRDQEAARQTGLTTPSGRKDTDVYAKNGRLGPRRWIYTMEPRM